MTSTATLQAIDTDLTRLSENLVACSSPAAQSLSAVESATEKLVAMRKDMSSLKGQNVAQLLVSVRGKARQVHALLEAAVAFHSKSLFGQAEAAGTYSSDGSLDKSHDSRIVFEG